MNLTPTQIISMILVTLGVLTASTTQLNDLIGPTAAKSVIALAGLGSSILAGWISIISGQSAQIQAVQAMPGVEKITVNAKANAALATLAADPTQDKIEATPASAVAVQATADRAATGS